MIIDNFHCSLFIFMFLLWQKCSPCQTGLLANHSTGNVLNYGMDIDTSAMQCLKVWILIHQICNVLKYGHWYFLCNVLKYGHPLPLHSKAHNLHLKRWKPLQKNIRSRRLVENTFSAERHKDKLVGKLFRERNRAKEDIAPNILQCISGKLLKL